MFSLLDTQTLRLLASCINSSTKAELIQNWAEFKSIDYEDSEDFKKEFLRLKEYKQTEWIESEDYKIINHKTLL